MKNKSAQFLDVNVDCVLRLDNRKHLSCYIHVAFFFFFFFLVKSEFSEANGFELAACVNSHDVGNLSVLELVKGDP